jgi:hypothetical protein
MFHRHEMVLVDFEGLLLAMKLQGGSHSRRRAFLRDITRRSPGAEMAIP